MPSSSTNVVHFVAWVTVVAVISQAAKQTGYLDGAGAVPLTIKGFLTFFSVSLLYFPVSLMLGGIPHRNKFFQRGV